MLRNAIICLTFVTGGTFLAPGELKAQSDLRAIVLERQILMISMQTSYWPLLDIKRGKSTDLAKAGAAAQTMRVAMVKALKLFPAGTAKGEVLGPGYASRAKPEIWNKPAAFEAAANELITASAKLVNAANSGDIENFRVQFQMVEQACIGCHEFRPTHGGKFRFPK